MGRSKTLASQLSHMFVSKACRTSNQIFQSHSFFKCQSRGTKTRGMKLKLTGNVKGCKTTRKSKSAIWYRDPLQVNGRHVCWYMYLFGFVCILLQLLFHITWWNQDLTRGKLTLILLLSFSQVHVAFNSINLNRDHAKKAVYSSS